MRMVRAVSVLAAACVALSACSAAIYSEAGPPEGAPPDEGLIYYLPKRDLVVTVTASKDKAPSITIQASDAYSDLAQAFRISYRSSWFGKNKMAVHVGQNGLLTTADSTTTSGIATALGSIASGLGTGAAMGMDQAASSCPGEGTFTQIIPIEKARSPAGTTGPCATSIKATLLEPSAERLYLPDDTTIRASKIAGIYYRNNLPYRIEVSWNTAEGRKDSRSAIILSPSGTTARRLPIEETLFAGNVATLGLVDGVPTKYEQEVSGEVTAFLGLPAVVIGAYFEAIGKMFAKDKDLFTAEKEALTATAALQYADYRRKKCESALAASDDTAIEEWCK